MDVEDVALRLRVWHREFDLAIDPARPDQRRVERLDLVRRHDHLDVAPLVEPIELIEKLEHRALYLARPPRARIVPLRSDRVDLVDEDDGGAQVIGDPEELAHELESVTKVFLYGVF